MLVSLGALLALWFVADGTRVILSLVEGRWFSEASRYLAIHQSLDPAVRTTSFYLEHGQPVLIRLAASVAAIGVVVAIGAARGIEVLRSFFAESATAHDLALARLVVFGAMFWWWLNNDVTVFAALPSELIVPPPGLSWATDWLPRQSPVVSLLSVLFAASSFAAMVGWKTKLSTWSATLVGMIVLGIPQFYGKIDHYHHFIWFGALLAAAPSGNAWSLDAWFHRHNGTSHPGPSRAYGYPLRTMMLLIGCFYFFAGFWKWVIGGPGWAGETMRTILHAQWMRIDWIPSIRVDQLGAWTWIGGTAVVAFELFFVAFILSRRLRPWVAASGVVFHVVVYLTTGINFWTLLVCYAVFINTSRASQPAEHKHTLPAVELSAGIRRLGLSLVVAAIVSGFVLIDSWPMAVYPTFAGMAEPNTWTVTIEGTAPDGRLVSLRPWRSRSLRDVYGNSRVGGLVSQVAWTQDPARRRDKAIALASVAAVHEPVLANMTLLRIYRELVAVDPARWSEPPLRRELLGEWRRADG